MPSRSPIKVRSLVASDVELFIQWIDRAGIFSPYGLVGEDTRPAMMAAIEDPHSSLFTAERDEKPIGCAWVVKKGGFARSAYLRLIAVDSLSRGSGVGHALMREVELRYLLPSGIILLTTTTNILAQQFYEKMGYARVGILPGYVKTGVDEAIYYKGKT